MIMTNLYIISRYSRTFFERRLSEVNVGFTEQLILMYLCKCSSVNQETIAKNFMLDKGSVAKTLNKLEKKKFITKAENPKSKREKLISITDRGQSIMGYMKEEMQEWYDYLFQALSPDEILHFERVVEKIAVNAVNVVNCKENFSQNLADLLTSMEEKATINQELNYDQNRGETP